MTHIGIALNEPDYTNGGIPDVYMGTDGNLATVTDAQAVGQHAKQRIKAFKGEWFLNANVGVPWLTDILGKGYDPALAESVIKSVVKKTDGVTEITSFSVKFERQKRALAASAITVATIYDQETDL